MKAQKTKSNCCHLCSLIIIFSLISIPSGLIFYVFILPPTKIEFVSNNLTYKPSFRPTYPPSGIPSFYPTEPSGTPTADPTFMPTNEDY